MIGLRINEKVTQLRASVCQYWWLGDGLVTTFMNCKYWRMIEEFMIFSSLLLMYL